MMMTIQRTDAKLVAVASAEFFCVQEWLAFSQREGLAEALTVPLSGDGPRGPRRVCPRASLVLASGEFCSFVPLESSR